MRERAGDRLRGAAAARTTSRALGSSPARACRLLHLGAALLVTLLASAASAAPIGFLEIGAGTGFDADFAPTLQLADAPTSYPAFPGGSEVSYTLDQALYQQGSSTPQPALPAGVAYTSVVTLTLDAAPTDDPILVLMIGMASDPAYGLGDVTFELDQPAGDDAFELVLWDYYGTGTLYRYLGFVMSEGDSVTFRYDVAAQSVGGTPVVITSATYDYTVVPEPGTALLLGLGLGGLHLSARRHGGGRDGVARARRGA